uniref:Cytospin-A (Trinotate prediction) n=1 Tax=Myxobolus squamalis TaxID=59785 RepID=A0A6B2G0C5_MYXSQ
MKSTLTDRSIWLKKKCADYIAQTLNRSISNFSFFWADGLAFIAILNRYTRSNMNFKKILSYSVEKRFSIIKHLSQKFNIKFDIKINDFLTFDENYLTEKVVYTVEAILNYDKSDTISPISKSIDFNLSPPAHQDLQSLQGAFTSTPQKPIKQITQPLRYNDESNFLTMNDIRIKKNLIKYFVDLESSKTSSVSKYPCFHILSYRNSV